MILDPLPSYPEQSLALIEDHPMLLYKLGSAMSDSGLHPLNPDEAAREPAAKVPPSRRRVLLIDDDAAIRQTLGEALQEDGFEVMVAPNGRQALELLSNRPRPAAILLDIMMPVMDG